MRSPGQGRRALASRARALAKVLDGYSEERHAGRTIQVENLDDDVLGDRADALSAVYAAWATNDSDVTFFRSNELIDWTSEYAMTWLLGDRTSEAPKPELIHENDVISWVESRYHAQSESRDGLAHIKELVSAGKKTTVLTYFAGGQARRLTVDARGTLANLARVAEDLADRYRWPVGQAATFVLTGQSPEIQLVTASAEVRYWDNSATTRLIMKVDPIFTPDQVAKLYRRIRATLQPSDRAPRPLSARQYRLAKHIGPHVQIQIVRRSMISGRGRRPKETATGFVIKTTPAPPHTWKTLFDQWTQLSPKDARMEVRNFQRAATSALHRMLSPGWRSDY